MKMKYSFKFSLKGFTLLELGLVIVLYSFIMLAVYTILDAGLKGWNIGHRRSDLQGNGEIVLRRMVRELSMSSLSSVIIDPNCQSVCFETPVLNGEYTYNQTETGIPYWNGYIIYYKNNDRLYRHYMDHPQRTSPQIYIPVIDDMTSPDDNSATPKHKAVLANVEKFNIDVKDNIVNIKFLCRKLQTKQHKNPNQDISRYSVSGTSENKGIELGEMQASVEPKN